VLLHESRSWHLVAVAAIGLGDRLFPEIRVPVGSGFAGHVAERREPVVIDRVDGMRFVPRYSENSITRDGPEMQRIAAAAGEHGIHVVLGFSERENGTLYMSQAFIDDTGRIISVRRKLKPTHVERSVFGEGDGSDIQVHDTSLGRLGGLNCWEHVQPLTKYAMYSLNEQIHVGSWPSFSVYDGVATALGPDVATAISRIYAVEGQTFVLAPTGLVGEVAHEVFCDTEAKKKLLPLGGGHARIHGPEGTELAAPLPEIVERLLFADLDFALIAIAKSAADPVGHYARPDVFRLHVNFARRRGSSTREPVRFRWSRSSLTSRSPRGRRADETRAEPGNRVGEQDRHSPTRGSSRGDGQPTVATRPPGGRHAVTVNRPRVAASSGWSAGTTAEDRAVQHEGQLYCRNTTAAST
jgi:nitrilase